MEWSGELDEMCNRKEDYACTEHNSTIGRKAEMPKITAHLQYAVLTASCS